MGQVPLESTVTCVGVIALPLHVLLIHSKYSSSALSIRLTYIVMNSYLSTTLTFFHHELWFIHFLHHYIVNLAPSSYLTWHIRYENEMPLISCAINLYIYNYHLISIFFRCSLYIHMQISLLVSMVAYNPVLIVGYVNISCLGLSH